MIGREADGTGVELRLMKGPAWPWVRKSAKFYGKGRPSVLAFDIGNKSAYGLTKANASFTETTQDLRGVAE